MTDVPDDELISAFLDGELSGEELARAEHLLATQPESRQLLEELRALRASLQGLPRRALEPGFGDRVLRRAEREMLQPSAAARRPTHAIGQPTLLSWQRWRRPLAWSAAAVAVALMVMVLSPKEQKVAVAPTPPDGELHATPAAPALAKREQSKDDFQAASRATAGAGPAKAPMPLEAPASDVALTTKEQQPVDRNSLFDAGDDRLLVVRCDVTGRAEAETALRGLLASNQIAWESSDRNTESIDAHDKQAVTDQVKSTESRLKAGQRTESEPSESDAVLVQAESQQLQTAIDTLATTRSFRNIRFERIDASAELLEDGEALSRLTLRLNTEPPVPAEESEANRTRPMQQRQHGTAMQLPFVEAQNLMRAQNAAEGQAYSSRAAGAGESRRDVGATAQNAPADAAARQADQVRPVPRQATRMSQPAPAANATSSQQTQNIAPVQMSRALIILRVAPEPPAEHEATPATP